MASGSREAGKRSWSFGESWGPGRCKSRSMIDQRGEENLDVCVSLTSAFAGTSLRLLEGSAEQVLPNK